MLRACRDGRGERIAVGIANESYQRAEVVVMRGGPYWCDDGSGLDDDCFPGYGGELPLSPEDIFTSITGGRRGGGAPAKYADAFRAEKAH